MTDFVLRSKQPPGAARSIQLPRPAQVNPHGPPASHDASKKEVARILQVLLEAARAADNSTASSR